MSTTTIPTVEDIARAAWRLLDADEDEEDDARGALYELCGRVALPPPDDAWFSWEGRRWACNGHVYVREDCPPLDGMEPTMWIAVQPDDQPEQMARPRRLHAVTMVDRLAGLPTDGEPFPKRLSPKAEQRLRDRRVLEVPEVRIGRLSTGAHVAVDARYAPLLDVGQARVTAPRGAVRVYDGTGALMAVVMPVRLDEEASE